MRHRTLSGALAAVFFTWGNVAPAADAQVLSEGERLYDQNCVFCHQADAIGKPGFAPSLSNPELLSIASDQFLIDTITAGRPGTSMPPFAHLGREGIKAIVAYLHSLSTVKSRAVKVDAQPAATGDVKHGQILFDNICLSCHGPKGDGYRSGGTGTAIGTVGFLSKASDGFIRETIKYGRTNTRMRGFFGPEALADLGDQDINDIIVYLRSLDPTAGAQQ